jgi:surface polysaccharide O-acyltransferase-like enzyme
MVIMVHSGEFFYIGANGTIIRDHTFWVNLYGSFLRISVPLFVIISGYLVLPIKETPSSFYKKRFTRILFPFIFWSVLYAIIPYFLREYELSEALANAAHIGINFQGSAGHLWFVYMLIGLYLFIPFISPWVSSASRRFKLFFLILWGLTLLIPFVKRLYPEIWGEAYWNQFHSAYYFSGYLGYLVLGNYLKETVLARKQSIIYGLLLLAGGYIITYMGFNMNMAIAKDIPTLELTWNFNTINVAMMSLGFFLVMKNVKIANERVNVLLGEMSNLSYGVFLAHILILNLAYKLIEPHFSGPAVTIPVVALTTFVLTYILIKLISYLPKSKYLVG